MPQSEKEEHFLSSLLDFKDKIDQDPKVGISVLEMIFKKTIDEPLEIEDISSVMNFLTKILAEADQLFALKIMICFYPIALKYFARDICDSIDLWFYETATKQLIPFIQKYLEVYPDTKIRDLCEEWISLI